MIFHLCNEFKNIKLKYQGLSSKKTFFNKEKKIELSNPLNKTVSLPLGLEDLLEGNWCYIRIDYR